MAGVSGDARELRFAFGRVDEQDVGAGGSIGIAPLQRGVEALGRDRVGARDHEDPIGAAVIDGDADALHHVRDRHHTLAVGMTAAARRLLIVDLDRSRTGALIIHHCAA